MTSLTVSGLEKSFGAHKVLNGLDLEVAGGSLMAVLGPSGSGKTTLLRIVVGIERADRGRIALNGTVVEDDRTHLPPEHRRIGYVPQDGALFPHLSVAGNVGFGLSRRQRRGGRVEELLALVGLAGQESRYPHQLSGGQQQRVALARALAPRPGLVLLDEPFASLDAALRASVRADVQRVLRETGTTAVLVTHDQNEALSLADQVAVLRGGRIVQCGGPEELYANPLDPTVARFVGDANLLQGVMRGRLAVTSLGALRVGEYTGARREAEQVVVLIRPEQIEVRVGTDADGFPGRIVESHYYGHDIVVSVETAQAAGSSTRIRARLSGRPPIPAGTAVTIRATGPVKVWGAESHPWVAVPVMSAWRGDTTGSDGDSTPLGHARKGRAGNRDST
jgi:iron(III) transport system ATP-binding protein